MIRSNTFRQRQLSLGSRSHVRCLVAVVFAGCSGASTGSSGGGTGGAGTFASGGAGIANPGSGGGAITAGSGGSGDPGTGGTISATGGSVGTGGQDLGSGGSSGGQPASGSGGLAAGGAGGTSGTPTGGASAQGGAGVGVGAGAACGTAKICDDFESYSGSNLAPWMTTVSGGAVKVDTTHVYSGRQSVNIHADMGANKSAQISRTGAPLFPATGNAFWGRMMVYMTGLPPAAVHYDNVQADGQGTGQYRIGGMGGILLNYQPHDCYDHIMPMLPPDKWVCWQWLYDGSKNTIDFYIDGALQAMVVTTGQGCVDGTKSTWAAPTFNAVHLGWINYQATPAAIDMWMDDVALGPDRIDCPAAGANPMAH